MHEKSDIQHLLNYIINKCETEPRNYSVPAEEQYEAALLKICCSLDENHKENTNEDLWVDISELVFACRKLFFEMGFREGIKLERQITEFVEK